MARARTRLNYAPIRTPVGEPRVHIQTLGACQIQVGNERLSPAGETLFSLVVRLVYAPDLRLTRDEILPMLWPGLPESRQRGNLRQALYKLRQLGVLMELHGDDVRLDERQVARTFAFERTDERFQRDVLDGHEPFGPFLPGFEPRSAEFKEWIDETRELVHAEVRRVLVSQLRRFREGGDWARAEQMARRLLQFDPLNEEATLTLAECTALNGGKAQAIEIIDRYLSELGADAGDIRIPATTLRRRIAEPQPRRVSFAPTERHFVGREEEIAELTLAMRRARWHDGSAYLIYGPPGMGKTRLTYEVAKVATLEGMFQLRFSCRESDGMRPLSLVLDLVTELLAAPGALGCAPDTLKHLRRLVGEEPVVLLEDGTPAPRDPLPGPSAIRRAIADILAAVSEEKPVFLVIDDVHWLDVQSWDVLVDLMERVEVTRVCMLLTSRKPHACAERPERVPMKLQVRELRRLTEEQSLALLQRIVEDTPLTISPEIEHRITNTCDGLPLFIRCLVEYWIDGGERNGIPPRVSDLIRERLEQMGSLPLRIVQTIGLLQVHATVAHLQDTLEAPLYEIVEALDALSNSGIIAIKDGVLSCHDTVVESALQRLRPSARCILNLQIAKRLLRSQEATFSNKLAALRHLHLAEFQEEFDRVAKQLLSELYTRKDAYRFLQSTQLIFTLRPGLQNVTEIQQWHLLMLYEAGRHFQMLECYRRYQPALHPVNGWDTTNPSEALKIAFSTSYVNRHAVVELCTRALAIAESSDVPQEIRGEAMTLCVRMSGDGFCDTLAKRAYQLVDQLVPDSASIRRFRIDMYYHTMYGDLRKAREATLHLLNAAEHVSSYYTRSSLLVDCAYALRFSGTPELALSLFEECHLKAISMDDILGASPSAYYLSLEYLERFNDLAHADKWAQRLISVGETAEEETLRIMTSFHKVRMAIAFKRFDEAESLYDASVTAHPTHRLSPRQRLYLPSLSLAIAIGLQDHARVTSEFSQYVVNRHLLRHRPAVDFCWSQLILAADVIGSKKLAEEIKSDCLRSRQDLRAPSGVLAKALHDAGLNKRLKQPEDN